MIEIMKGRMINNSGFWNSFILAPEAQPLLGSYNVVYWLLRERNFMEIRLVLGVANFSCVGAIPPSAYKFNVSTLSTKAQSFLPE